MCTYMRVWTSLSLFLVTSSHQVLPNRFNLDSKSIQFGLKYRLLGTLGPQQGPGGSQESAKTILASTFGSYSSPFGYRCVSENVFFLVFRAGLFLHALRRYSDWLGKHKIKISQKPKVDLVS